MRIRISVADPSATLHAVLSAVQGRVFCVSFSRDVRPFADASGLAIENVEQSWRSNFSRRPDKPQQATSGSPDERSA